MVTADPSGKGAARVACDSLEGIYATDCFSQNNQPVEQTEDLDRAFDVVTGALVAKAVFKSGFTKAIFKPLVGLVCKIFCKKHPEEGIYVIRTSYGVYVGQSGDIATRLKSHINSGKFSEGDIESVVRISIKGGKTQREIAEQRMIDELGGVGSPLILNKNNPIGKKRIALMGKGYVRR